MNLVVLKTDIGQLFTLAIEESRLSNLGGHTENVTLKLLTDIRVQGEIVKYDTRDGIIAVINNAGKLFISCQRQKDLHQIFGKWETHQNGFFVRNLIPLGKNLKFKDVSVGNKHLICVDHLDRVFGIGCNKSGQLGGAKKIKKYKKLTRTMKSFSHFKNSNRKTNRIRFVECGHDSTVFCVENIDSFGNVESCFLVYRGRNESRFCQVMPKVSVNAKQVVLVQDVVFVASSYENPPSN